MTPATTGSKLMRLVKSIPPLGIGSGKIRRVGEHCVILRNLSDGLGRSLLKVIFDDGDERVLLTSDVEEITDGQGTN
jgi:hypothetical protein